MAAGLAMCSHSNRGGPGQRPAPDTSKVWQPIGRFANLPPFISTQARPTVVANAHNRLQDCCQ